MGWYGRSLKTRLGIGLGIVAVLATGLAALFLVTGGAELLFGPTVPVTFATIDAQPDFRRVTLTGELSLPATMPMDGDSHSVYLSDPANPGRSVGVSVRVAQAGVTAAPNQMDELPLIYSDDDLRVCLASGSSAHHGDLVRVTGPVRSCTAGGEPLRCIDAEVIESGE